MVQRKEYMDKLILWKERKVIKVVTGIRRCGKSTLLKQFREFLINSGVQETQCVFVQLDDIKNEELRDYHKLYEYVTERITEDNMHYIFLDEVQLVPEFQKAVDSLYLRDNVDIYLTGSNAYMLSGEIATLLSGRFVEIKMLPFSFKEYYEMLGGVKDKREVFKDYYIRGGFPYASTIEDFDAFRDYIMGIYNTVLLKDIVERKKVSDVKVLESVIHFLADNVGNIVSAKKIADTLTSMNRKTSSITVDNYINALQEAFIMYEAQRYDIKGKQYLQSLSKYYLVDMSIRTVLLGAQARDMGHILENIVYLELLRRGYDVYIGKVDTEEVDFVARKGDERIYYQVSATVMDATTFEREIRPLKKIQDNYPKYLLTMDEFPIGEDGINQVNIIDFLMA
ncbi:MAG: ATP-binding protein [Lachnospira sp.]|nr:ATP-binding protein [Lachnospira sp.]